MAELVDALDSGSSQGNLVDVRVILAACLFRRDMHIAIVANGMLDFAEKVAKKRAQFSSFVAVDGGLKHCDFLGIAPNLIIGDFDSIPKELLPKYEQVEKKSFPEDKDETDLEIALRELASPERKITVFGGFGERVDHTLANLVLLSRYPGNVTFETDRETIFAVSENVTLKSQVGQRISLLPINGPAEVSSQGLKWQLNHRTLDKQFVGISNVAVNPTVTITVHSGDLLCFVEESS